MKERLQRLRRLFSKPSKDNVVVKEESPSSPRLLGSTAQTQTELKRELEKVEVDIAILEQSIKPTADAAAAAKDSADAVRKLGVLTRRNDRDRKMILRIDAKLHSSEKPPSAEQKIELLAKKDFLTARIERVRALLTQAGQSGAISKSLPHIEAELKIKWIAAIKQMPTTASPNPKIQPVQGSSASTTPKSTTIPVVPASPPQVNTKSSSSAASSVATSSTSSAPSHAPKKLQVQEPKPLPAQDSTPRTIPVQANPPAKKIPQDVTIYSLKTNNQQCSIKNLYNSQGTMTGFHIQAAGAALSNSHRQTSMMEIMQLALQTQVFKDQVYLRGTSNSIDATLRAIYTIDPTYDDKKIHITGLKENEVTAKVNAIKEQLKDNNLSKYLGETLKEVVAKYPKNEEADESSSPAPSPRS